MRAVLLDYTTRRLETREVAPPEPGAGEVLLRVHEVGVCGTDRELASFRFGHGPAGEDTLILGHEAVAQVVSEGRVLRPGDWVVPAVRRACAPPCASCARGRRDLCVSGRYTERGILGAHGYYTEFAVDEESDLARVPAHLVDVAVLIEPLSVVEKAADLALRLHPGGAGSALVIGAGTIGILAALVLRARGMRVVVVSREPEQSSRAKLVRAFGFAYAAGPAGRADIVLECAGAPEAATAALESLAPLGVVVLLGAARVPDDFPILNLIVHNQVIAGSVNAGPGAVRRAVEDLAAFPHELLGRMIGRRSFDAYRDSIFGAPGEEPKLVHRIE